MAGGVKRAEMVGGYEIRHIGEYTGQSFAENQFVKLTSGQLALHGDNADLEQLAGMVMKAATTVQATLLPVAVLKPGGLVRMSCYHVTPASAVATKADIGKGVQIVTVSAKSVADVATFGAESKASFIIVDVEGDSDTEQYRRIVCAPKASHCALYDGLATES